MLDKLVGPFHGTDTHAMLYYSTVYTLRRCLTLCVRQSALLYYACHAFVYFIRFRFHAGGHNIACETANSARFKTGAGRRVGEMCEQLWASMKVCAQRCCPDANWPFILCTDYILRLATFIDYFPDSPTLRMHAVSYAALTRRRYCEFDACCACSRYGTAPGICRYGIEEIQLSGAL